MITNMFKHPWKSQTTVILLSLSSLILPSFMAPWLPNSTEGIISEMGLIAQAQDTPATTEKKLFRILNFLQNCCKI